MLTKLLASELLKLPNDEDEITTMQGKVAAIPYVKTIDDLTVLHNAMYHKYRALEKNLTRVSIKHMHGDLLSLKQVTPLTEKDFFV
jgi:hypothetical protein